MKSCLREHRDQPEEASTEEEWGHSSISNTNVSGFKDIKYAEIHKSQNTH
jgi:hypothetical protein